MRLPRWLRKPEPTHSAAHGTGGSPRPQPVEEHPPAGAHPRCVRCGDDIDPEDLRPDPLGDMARELGAKLGLTAADLAGPIADVNAQIYARRCDRCPSWMCHVCVARVTEDGRESARHEDCGGTFRPKNSPS